MSAVYQEGTPSPPAKAYFGGGAALYDRSRPTYPEALITRIAGTLPGRDILDVGCGSGIEARQFQAAGCTVLGVDPDARMAEYARSTGVPVEVGTFETWAAAGRTFDGVVAGTAWHWVDPLAGATRAAEALRPGGLLAPFHHASLTPPELADAAGMSLPAWGSRSADAYRRVAPDSLFDLAGQRRSPFDLYQPLFDRIADGIRQTGSFTEPEQWRFDWERTYSRDEWLELLPTQGALAKLSPDELAGVLDAVGAVIDRMGGSFSLPYATVAVTAVRRDAG
ncbi:class I SAM-dependent methyltransferase [Plantactinospora endophytica]|uniref:Methyltransferase type 11 n=1 Tax=Plantactinospora endophytica TaxID=673535 RepID=A0ABQ4E024_9ACTN|nr:class I SAM-dependent methyltransferase [Plantactinospora endophytica]GIG88041.1 methyltransferase type 11 [Plantactinospora endophytica]